MKENAPVLLKKSRDFSVLARLSGWLFCAFWAFRILKEHHAAFLPETSMDTMLFVLIFVFAAGRKSLSPFLAAFCMLSYEIHAQSALRVESFSLFYAVSWLGCTYLAVTNSGSLASLILYHAGINFDPGSAVTLGTGMQAGLTASPVATLFFLFFVRELWNDRIYFVADLRHYLIAASLAWLAIHHSSGAAADLTSQFLAFAGAAFLVMATCAAADEKSKTESHIVAVAAGGLLVIGAAVTNQMLESATLSEFFSRRAWAGSLHPNHIATWCLAAIWALHAVSPGHKVTTSNSKVFLSTAMLLMIFISGARLILLIAFLSLSVHYAILFWRQHWCKETKTQAQASLSGKRLFVIVLSSLLLMVSIRILYKFNLHEFTQNERFFIWKAALELVAAAPVAGYGVLQFAMLPQRAEAAAVPWIYDWNYPHAHQGLIELALWGGVPLLLMALACWLTAARRWIASGMAVGFFAVSATLLADFTWRTPAMILWVIFFILPPEKASEEADAISAGGSGVTPALKVVLSCGIAAVIVWLANVHSGFLSYNSAITSLVTGQGSWKEEVNLAVTRLPFSSDVRMQRLLWKISRERLDDESAGFLTDIRKNFPGYWPAVFAEARLAELTGSMTTALDLYNQTLQLENVDLSGIRHARAALLAYRLQDHRFDSLLQETLMRGEWGVAILLNHPDHGEYFKKSAMNLVVGQRPADFFGAVRLARVIKNLARAGLAVNQEIFLRLADFTLPDWLVDQVFSELSLCRARQIAEKYREADLTGTGSLRPRFLSPADRNEIDAIAAALCDYGPASLRTLGWIRLEQADPGGFIAAYDRMMQQHNFRNKNYEDLTGQFLFARFAIQTGEYLQALDMLQKLTAFDASNPFISRLKAMALSGLHRADDSSYYVNLAAKQARQARLDPYYREEPRDLLWPQGDQWVFLLEKVFRLHDPEAARYCATEWDKFVAGLVGPSE